MARDRIATPLSATRPAIYPKSSPVCRTVSSFDSSMRPQDASSSIFAIHEAGKSQGACTIGIFAGYTFCNRQTATALAVSSASPACDMRGVARDNLTVACSFASGSPFACGKAVSLLSESPYVRQTFWCINASGLVLDSCHAHGEVVHSQRGDRLMPGARRALLCRRAAPPSRTHERVPKRRKIRGALENHPCGEKRTCGPGRGVAPTRFARRCFLLCRKPPELCSLPSNRAVDA